MSDMPTPDHPTPDPGDRPADAVVEREQTPVGPGSQSPDAPGPDADTPPGMQAVAPPSRRSKFLRFGIIVGTLVIVWGVILPQFIDYQEIVDTLASLGPQQMLLMLALASVAWVLQGAILSTTLPGLSLWRGFQSWMIMAALGSSIPAGPFNLAIVYVVYRGWGFAPGPSSATLLLYGLFDQLSRLLLPAFALVFVLLAGYQDPDFFLIAAVGVVIVVAAIGVVMGILRSEALAQRIGRIIERIMSRVLGVFKRATPEGIPQAIVRFRDQFGDTLRASGPLSFAIALLSKMAWAIVLIAALRIVGVPADELPASWIFAVFAAVFVITILPIAPGGAGVPELLYISMLTQLAPGYETEISSGVFLYRIYQWFLPIPIGWVLLWVARRGRGGLLSTSVGPAPAPAAG